MKILKLICLLSVILVSCSKKDATTKVTVTDKELFELAKYNPAHSWFKKNDTIYSKSTASGHSQPFLKTRYNSVAYSKFDSLGNLNDTSVFPEGSLIIKELLDEMYQIDRYAILYKNSTHEFADDKGWVWGYLNKDGSVIVSSSLKGNSCISCHSQNGSVDRTLMSTFF